MIYFLVISEHFYNDCKKILFSFKTNVRSVIVCVIIFVFVFVIVKTPVDWSASSLSTSCVNRWVAPFGPIYQCLATKSQTNFVGMARDRGQHFILNILTYILFAHTHICRLQRAKCCKCNLCVFIHTRKDTHTHIHISK